MSKLDDTKDALLDAITLAAQKVPTSTVSVADTWGKVAANLGQAYVSVSSEGGLFGHMPDDDDDEDLGQPFEA